MVEEVKETVVETPPVVKKRRGRPPKAKPEVDPTAVVAEAVVAPKKRGRPRKVKVDEAVETPPTVETPPVVESPPTVEATPVVEASVEISKETVSEEVVEVVE